MGTSKRICVRFGLQELQDLTWLQMNGGGWDPSVIIRRAVKAYRQFREEALAAEQKRQEQFLSGKLSKPAKTPLLQRKAKAKAAAGKVGA